MRALVQNVRIILAAFLLAPAFAVAQGAGISLNTGSFDSGQPVEVSADNLTVDQNSGKATFDGNVLVVQGAVRMSASQVIVEYATDDDAANGIERLLASGGVTFVTESEAAEAASAIYSIADNSVTMEGNVLLTQGRNALSGERLVLDLETGKGRMEGRVRTVIGTGNE